MATNCPQLLNPRGSYETVREMSCNICEKMLHTLPKAASSSDCLKSFQPQVVRDFASFSFPLASAAGWRPLATCPTASASWPGDGSRGGACARSPLAALRLFLKVQECVYN